MLTKLVAGTRDRKTRLHDELGHRIPLGRLLRNGGRALAGGLMYKLAGRRSVLPWISFDGQELVRRHLRPGSRVLEFGSGSSTAWYAARSGHVTSIEHDPDWHAMVARDLRARSNVDYRLVIDFDAYATAAVGSPQAPFDLIMVDGMVRDRCLEASLSMLADGGMIYLDNSDKAWASLTGDIPRARRMLIDHAAAHGLEIRTITDFAPGLFAVTEAVVLINRPTRGAVPPAGGRPASQLPATPSDRPSHAGPVDLLYVAGTGRCGTTFLDVMLGQQPGLWTSGELHLLQVWRDEDQRCGCGERMSGCPFWQDVAARVDAATIEEVGRLRRLPHPRGKALRWRHLLGGAQAQDGPGYRAANIALLRAVRDVAAEAGHAPPVIVDASKDVYRLRMLAGADTRDLALRALHVWRDPHGLVAHLIQLRRAFRPLWALRYAVRWAVENRLIADAIARLPAGRGMTIQFDRLMDDFPGGMQRVAGFAGGGFDAAMLASTRERPNHGVSGNTPRWRQVTPRKPAHDDALDPLSAWIVDLCTASTVRRLRALDALA